MPFGKMTLWKISPTACITPVPSSFRFSGKGSCCTVLSTQMASILAVILIFPNRSSTSYSVVSGFLAEAFYFLDEGSNWMWCRHPYSSSKQKILRRHPFACRPTLMAVLASSWFCLIQPRYSRLRHHTFQWNQGLRPFAESSLVDAFSVSLGLAPRWQRAASLPFLGRIWHLVGPKLKVC